MNKQNTGITYWKHEGHRGKRYFKMVHGADKALQICLDRGDVRKGCSNCVGVYVVERLTVISNYAFLSDFGPCTQKEWQQAMGKVVDILIDETDLPPKRSKKAQKVTKKAAK